VRAAAIVPAAGRGERLGPGEPKALRELAGQPLLVHAVRALSEAVDLILVVGAQNSSNSNRLREIGEMTGTRSHLIDSADSLDPAWLEGAKVVGITAGASAPELLVQELIARLGERYDVSVETLDGIQENVHFRLPVELADPVPTARSA